MRDWLAPFEPEMRAALDALVAARRTCCAPLAHHLFRRARRSASRTSTSCATRISRERPTVALRPAVRALGLTYGRDDRGDRRGDQQSREPSLRTSVGKPHETRLDSRANLGQLAASPDRDEIERIRELTEETAAALLPGTHLVVIAAGARRGRGQAAQEGSTAPRGASGSAIGRVVPPRRFEGIPGRVHFNDFMFLNSSSTEVASYAERARNVLALIDETLALAGRTFEEVDELARLRLRLRPRPPLPRRARPTGAGVRDRRDSRRRRVLSHRSSASRRFARNRTSKLMTIGTFDFIYAISVITHLNERNSRAFLRLVGDSLAEEGDRSLHDTWRVVARARRAVRERARSGVPPRSSARSGSEGSRT